MRVADIQVSLRRVLDAWEETKHPRGKGGKFSRKGEGGSASSASTSPDTPKAEKPKKSRAAASKPKAELSEEDVEKARPDRYREVAKEWAHPSTGEKRFYFNGLSELYGLDHSRYGTGNISYAELNGEKISNNKARQLLYELGNGKLWYSSDDGKFHGKGISSGVFDDLIGKIKANADTKTREDFAKRQEEAAAEKPKRAVGKSKTAGSTAVAKSYRTKFDAHVKAFRKADAQAQKSAASAIKVFQKGVLPAKEFIRKVVEEARARGMNMPKPSSIIKLAEAFDRHQKEHVLLDISDMVLKRAREQRPELPGVAAKVKPKNNKRKDPEMAPASPHAEELNSIESSINADRGDLRSSMKSWPSAMRAAMEGRNGDGPAILPYRGHTANIRSPEEYADAVKRSTMTASGSARRMGKQIADFVLKTRVIPRAPR